MWTATTIREIRAIRGRRRWTRDQVLAHQRKRFREIVRMAWRDSPFYRDCLSAHGARESDLNDITVGDLPIINKEILMENFNRVSRDPLLTRSRLEDWIGSDAPIGPYRGKYMVMHTSGTSGGMGIYVYGRHDWCRMKAIGVVRSGVETVFNPFECMRIAFIGAVHGRFAGVTSFVTTPSVVARRLVCSVLDSLRSNVEKLNRFQPQILLGYPSAIGQLAECANSGALDIRPRSVATSGEPLTSEVIGAVEEAWGRAPLNCYAASESLCIGMQREHGPGLSLMEDEHVVEILDERNQPVHVGETGRVVMTCLYNRALPILRYDMRDYVTRGERLQGEVFEPILSVDGRVNDALPILLRDGSEDLIHPIVLSEFFVPGVEKFQFVSHSPTRVLVRYVAANSMDSEIVIEFKNLLRMKDASASVVTLPVRETEIAADPRTGKYRLVVVETSRRV